MHILLRERHGLEEGAVAEDLGQTPADLVVLSFSDSDISAFAAAWEAGRDTLPGLRLANLARLRHPLSVDLYVENTLFRARAILIRLLGGADYWRYGLDEIFSLAKRNGIALAVVPGDGRPDPALEARSTVPADLLARLKTLTDTGGAEAARAALAELAHAAGLAIEPLAEPAALPRFGFYNPRSSGRSNRNVSAAPEPPCVDAGRPETTPRPDNDGPPSHSPSQRKPGPIGSSADAGAGGDAPRIPAFAGDVATEQKPRVLIAFYRAFLAAADTEPVDQLYTIMQARGFEVAAAFVPSLKDSAAAAWLANEIAAQKPDVIVNMTAFSAIGDNGRTPFSACDAPVLQIALAGSDRRAWLEADRGLSPADLAMHVVLPEIDGRIFAGVASFKAPAAAAPELGFAPRMHRAEPMRIAAIAGRATALARLRRTPRRERRLALLLSTYPGRADQVAHAVGLDAPTSACAVLQDLAAAGYTIENPPATGAELLARLAEATLPTSGEGPRLASGVIASNAKQSGTAPTDRPESHRSAREDGNRKAIGMTSWPLVSYLAAYRKLPEVLRREIETVWGAPETDPALVDGHFGFSLLNCGNVTVALQPER
ncbi:MAG: cobaltochelatase subunit CobN, partial [Hyphomicrobiales bacterium]|nr:cobaltochelatase subunit CobN [Hyphomicrobiales bacterium]